MMKPNDLNLFYYRRSSCSWRVRWALAIKNIPHTLTEINLLEGKQNSDEYRKISPTGQVPALLIEERKNALIESPAILEWIEESFPDTPLLPIDKNDRAFVRSLCLVISAGTQPLQNLRVLKHVERLGETRLNWAQTYIRMGLKSFEDLLKADGRHGNTCTGNTLSFADLCLVPQVYNAYRYQINVAAEFPVLENIYRYALSLESCRKVAPDDADAPKP